MGADVQKIGGRKTSNSNPTASGSATLPAIQIEEEEREYTDAGTITEPVRILPIEEEGEATEVSEAGPSSASSPAIPQDHPPAYSAKPDSVSEQEVLDRCHPRAVGLDADAEQDYDTLVGALGVRCHVIEEEMKAQKADRAKRGLGESCCVERREYGARRTDRSDVESDCAQPRRDQQHCLRHARCAHGEDGRVHLRGLCRWVGSVLAHGNTRLTAVGLMAGSHFLTGGNGMHPRDAQLFLAFNTLAQSVGAGEGILPGSAKGLAGVVGAGAGLIGRVPT